MLHFKSNNFACASYLTGWFGKGAIALYKMLLSTPMANWMFAITSRCKLQRIDPWCRASTLCRALNRAHIDFFLSSTSLSTRFPPVRPFLASHFHTDWLSWLGLGNQEGSTNDHLANRYLPSTPKDQSMMRAESSPRWPLWPSSTWSCCSSSRVVRLWWQTSWCCRSPSSPSSSRAGM